MRNILHPVRPGLTAIAAVLALSSTPSFAQAADPAAAPLVTPPPVVSAPAATNAPAAAAPAVQSTAPASGGLVTVPIRPGPMTVQSSAAPAPIITEDTTPAPVVRSTPRAAATRSAPIAAPRVTAMPAQAAPAKTAPAAAERLAPVAPVIAPAPAPVAKAPATARPTSGNDDSLPIAGAAGAAILLIGGGLYAASRRRRPVDEQVYAADTVETSVAPVTAPAVYAAPVVAPVMAEASRPVAQPHGVATPGETPFNKLPSGFDTSRFGRHTQAAYQGPTADNPFLSLKRRLKRASFYDGRERMAAEGGGPIADRVTSPAAQAAPAQRQTEFVTTRLQRPARPGFRPAYSN